MREIKFRVFAKKSKIMFVVDEIIWKGNRIHQIRGVFGDNEPIGARRGFVNFSKDLAIMQSTGLKDKKGVEIFEGDVVKCYNKHLNYDFSSDKNIPGYGFAVIKNSGWSFYYDKIKADNKWFFYYPEGDNFYPDNIDMIIEVIGNIHENPELLEEK